MLPPIVEAVADHLRLCDGFVFTGGDDPRTEEFGQQTHPNATPMNDQRQRYEVALLRALEAKRREAPVLGVCLGMQLMTLVAGGKLDQYLPESHPSHEDHYGKDHPVRPRTAGKSSSQTLEGVVASHHRHAGAGPGALAVIAVAPDGVIEAVEDSSRHFYLGVQWHPERTSDPRLGRELFDRLIRATRA
jgi:putative glutamine amidotransferase